MTTEPSRPSRLQRWILPGLAFKAVVIGGGYATGRELAEFFLPSGPGGGLLAILISTILWSVVCALTFSYAFTYKLLDYRAFFGKLLGRGWILFEITYFLLVLLILSVFGATIGAIGNALFGWSSLVGALLLLTTIAILVAIGANAVEPLFKYVSVLLYITYAVFLALSLSKFGARILSSLHTASIGSGWLLGGVTYSGYNLVGAVAILPVLRHLTSRRGCLDRRGHRRTARDAARTVLLPLHDRVVPGNRACHAAVGLPVDENRHPSSPTALSNHDLLRAAGKRLRSRARDHGEGRRALRAGTGREVSVGMRAALTLRGSDNLGVCGAGHRSRRPHRQRLSLHLLGPDRHFHSADSVRIDRPASISPNLCRFVVRQADQRAQGQGPRSSTPPSPGHSHNPSRCRRDPWSCRGKYPAPRERVTGV